MSQQTILEWHEPPELPAEGLGIILEIWGRHGRTNGVGHGEYLGDGEWSFGGDDRTGMLEGTFPTDHVCRWAHYPEPSWVEPA